jgi:archaellum component FlaC
VQELTKKAIEQARGNTAASAELGKLKDELEKLKKQNQAMQERLDRLEKVEKKTP